MFGMNSKKQNKEKQAVTAEQQVQEQETVNAEPSVNEHDSEEKSSKKAHAKKDNRDLQIEELNTKLAEFSDKHLRLQAEFDNFRKRTMKEKADLIKSGGESVLINILPIVDDFERELGLNVSKLRYLQTARELHLLSDRNFWIWFDLTHDTNAQIAKLKDGAVELDLYNRDYEYIDLRIPGQGNQRIFYMER